MAEFINIGRAKDLTGVKSGRLRVVRPWGYTGGVLQWLCSCSCGGVAICRGYNLRSGRSGSCGCVGLVTLEKTVRTLQGAIQKIKDRQIYCAEVQDSGGNR